MRNTNINNSIANVIRFSVRVNEMLCALAAPQLRWHLQPCVGTAAARSLTSHDRLHDSATGSGSLSLGTKGSLLPGISDRMGY